MSHIKKKPRVDFHQNQGLISSQPDINRKTITLFVSVKNHITLQRSTMHISTPLSLHTKIRTPFKNDEGAAFETETFYLRNIIRGENNILCCPFCCCENVHTAGVEIRHGDDENATDLIQITEDALLSRKQKLSTHNRPRKFGIITIQQNCESGCEFLVEMSFHKGSTYFHITKSN